MAASKKFGTFGGVFTPSILTILGVIMYLRMGWIVGNSTIGVLLGVILLAHAISVSTGLSISSIATDKKVGAGGVYYVLSRSLGLPIGGALGLTLFVATALSIALYMVGFAEIFNKFIGFGFEINEVGETVRTEFYTNSLRITGSIGLLALTILAFISTSIALKSQYFILGAIVLSLFSIFLGDPSNVTAVNENVDLGSNVGFAAIFAIFFPAVTGFTAGVAMSGDLKDPKRAIPIGTMGSIAIGLIVYSILALFIYYSFDSRTLIGNSEVLFEMALVPFLVFLGVWGATLSSALGGILGGPRILQAMSVDKITPKIFAKGVGQSNEPRNALILTVLIAEGGILIGDLNVIAEVVSMFYLSAYGFINLSFFLESWASSDFNPTFKVKKWIGLVGFIATFFIMSQLNALAMVVAIIIIAGVYLFLSRKQIALGTGDIWQSVWSTIVKKGLKRMEAGKDHKRNWKPNILLFSTESVQRTKMIEFSKAVSGQAGIITNFDLYENPEAGVLFPKNKEAVSDEDLEKYGIFGRKLEVQNIFKGIESIACTFGFSGIEPNTVLMNWPGQTKDPVWFKEMTEKLIALDYNVLYLDYDQRWGFRKKEKIDLWWRGVGNNAELMLSLAKFITASPNWSQANIRILLVNDTNVDFKIVENRINKVIEQFRVKAEIKIVNNEVDKKTIYDLMKIHSSEADLVFVGIPEINPNEREEFVEKTNNLVSIIGTTLLVKASSQFDETDLKLEQIALKHEPKALESEELFALEECVDSSYNQAINRLDEQLEKLAANFIQNGIQSVENYHHVIFSKVVQKMDAYLETSTQESEIKENYTTLLKTLDEVKEVYADALANELPLVFEQFEKENQNYFQEKENTIAQLPKKVVTEIIVNEEGEGVAYKRKVKYKEAIQRIWLSEGIKNSFDSLLTFGYQNLVLLHQSKNILHEVIEKLLRENINDISLETINSAKAHLDNKFHQINKEALNLASDLYKSLRNNERKTLNSLAKIVVSKKYNQQLQEQYQPLPNKVFQLVSKGNKTFSSYWYRNMILFTYHLNADIYLIEQTVRIEGLIEKINSYTSENYLSKIQENITDVSKLLTRIESQINEDLESEILVNNYRIKEELFFNSEYVISTLMNGVGEMTAVLPEEIELMTAKSINAIREAQGDQIVTEKIALKDISEYIIRSSFVDPLHERIQVFYDQLKRVMSKLINATILVQKGIDNYASSGKITALKEALNQANQDLKELNADFDTACQLFETELIDRQEILNKELNINQIVEQVETLRQYVKKQKRRNKIFDSLQQANQVAGKKVNSFLNYIAQRQRDISAIEYKQKYSDVVSEQGLFAEFVEKTTPIPSIPFYYQQLFIGTHYSDSKTLENRRAEIDKIKAAIHRIDGGNAGAIMILGRAGSGKTYLTKYAMNQLLKGGTYKIVPPIRRSWTKDDLLIALQRATGSNEPLQKLMNKLPAKSTIIFENLEQWWLKAEDGNQIINELTKLINKFGSKHYFILNSNIYAYQVMIKSAIIQDAIIQSAVLPPLTALEIKDVIWSRHQTGGFRIKLEGEKEQHVSVSKLNKHLNRFHTTSDGNIGLALHQWVESIKDVDENTLTLSTPDLKEIPLIEKEEWKNMIFQLLIHYNLSREELYRIYGTENKNWINRVLQALRTSNIVIENERGEFILKKETKPYIENWLNESGFIK